MAHQFEADIAVEYGVNAAVLFQNISFWCAKNKANGHNYFDGRYWTYNSRRAFTELFPYLSERQIKTAIDKLVDDGMLVTGCYNRDPRDRSLWYAVTEKGWCKVQNRIVHYTEMSNAQGEDVTPLPDSKPISIKPDKKHTPRKRADSDFSAGFMEFWKLYPRKVAKPTAHRAWLKTGADDSKALKDSIIADIRRRVNGEWNDKDVQYIPHPSTYLNQRRWEDEPPKPEPEKPRHLYSENLSPEELMRRQKEQAEKDREEARRQGLL